MQIGQTLPIPESNQVFVTRRVFGIAPDSEALVHAAVCPLKYPIVA